MANKIYYDYEKDGFYELLEVGYGWNNTRDNMVFLRAIPSRLMCAVPDYIFHMYFIKVNKIQLEQISTEMGWSEFELKKVHKYLSDFM